MSSPWGFLHFCTLWALAVGKICNSSLNVEDNLCSIAHSNVQSSSLLQTGLTGERLGRENSTINYTLDKPGSERHATRNRLSFANLRDHLPSLESIRVFFMMLLFGTPTFSHH